METNKRRSYVQKDGLILFKKNNAEPCVCRGEPWNASFVVGVATSGMLKGMGFPAAHYDKLLRKGYCRSGEFFYVYNCKGCNLCKSLRVPVAEFVPNKRQRRILRKNSDVRVVVEHCMPGLGNSFSDFVTDEKVQLFLEFWNRMNKDSQERTLTLDSARDILGKIYNNRFYTFVNICFYLGDRLVGVSLCDLVCDASARVGSLSSNYFFYVNTDDVLKRSLGVYSLLLEIEMCRNMGLSYYYLGHYNAVYPKLSYKANYKPYELLIDKKWVRYDDLTPEQIASLYPKED